MTTSIEIAGARHRSDWNQGDDPIESPPAAPSTDAESGRAERAAADLRYQAYSAGSGHTASVCGAATGAAPCAPEIVANPVLFRREGTDPAAVDRQDVQQGHLGDCYLMAAMAGVASTPEGRALLQGAIVENKNDKGDVVSYTVTLHRPKPPFLHVGHQNLFGRTTFTDVKITVSAPFACGHAVARPDGNEAEIWPLVIEKAYAAYLGSVDQIGRGGYACVALEVLTGREATHEAFGWLGYGTAKLERDLAACKILVLDTKPGVERERGDLVGEHSYVVTGLCMDRGKLCVSLFNPWNDHQPPPIPCDELGRLFACANIGSVR